jgi:hypothetical protein
LSRLQSNPVSDKRQGIRYALKFHLYLFVTAVLAVILWIIIGG